MFLCYFQPSQNRELQKPRYKGCFLPLRYFEKMGEILSSLPAPGLYKTETIKQEGEGDDERHGQVVFLGFLFVCFSFFWLKLQFWSNSSLLCTWGGRRIRMIY